MLRKPRERSASMNHSGSPAFLPELRGAACARLRADLAGRDRARRLLDQSRIVARRRPIARHRRRRKPLRPEPATPTRRPTTSRGQALARSGKTEEALAEFDRGDRRRSPQCGRAVQSRPALSGRKAASARDRRFHRGQRPDAAAGRAAARPRDQLPRARQGQGGRRRSRRGRRRPTRRTRRSGPRRGLAYERLGDKTKAAGSYGQRHQPSSQG